MSSSSASASKVEPGWLFLSSFLLAWPIVFGCGTEPCADLPAECTPLYEPTFTNVYENTLRPSCAVIGTSCHASEGRQAGLDFGDIDRAHQSLRSVVKLEDVACSPILARLESTELGFSMPPGRPLAAAERCAIRRYIESGAPR